MTVHHCRLCNRFFSIGNLLCPTCLKKTRTSYATHAKVALEIVNSNEDSKDEEENAVVLCCRCHSTKCHYQPTLEATGSYTESSDALNSYEFELLRTMDVVLVDEIGTVCSEQAVTLDLILRNVRDSVHQE